MILLRSRRESQVSLHTNQRLLQREDVLLLKAEKAAGKRRTTEIDFLDRGVCLEPSVFGDGHLDDSPRQFLRKVCVR